MKAELCYIFFLGIRASATTTDQSESSSALNLRGLHPTVDFGDYVAEKRNIVSHGGGDFLDEGSSCRGRGSDCLTNSVCCSGRCEAISYASVAVCVPQGEEFKNFAEMDTNFIKDTLVEESLEESGYCRNNGRQCLLSSLCCSGRCVYVPTKMVCSA